MKRKRILVVSLCAGLILSSSIGFAGEAVKKTKLTNGLPINSTSRGHLKIVDIGKPVEIPKQKASLKVGSKDGTLYQGERASSHNGDPFKDDKYHLGQEDLEELMKKGHTIKDIFKADEIGNRLNEDPKNLLQRKKEKGQDWDKIEKDIFKERAERLVNRLKKSHPSEFEQLQSEQFSTGEQLKLLSMYDKQLAPSMPELIKTYKENGEEGLKKLIQNQKFHGRVSKEKMDKYGLTKEDAKGLSDDMIDKMEILSKKANVSVKELIRGYQAKVRAAGRGRVE